MRRMAVIMALSMSVLYRITVELKNSQTSEHEDRCQHNLGTQRHLQCEYRPCRKRKDGYVDK
jgi:hypothetical protein